MKIPYGRQNITQSDIDGVIATLKSDFLTQGPRIKEFEESFARYVDAKYAVAVANGTAALHLCNMTLGLTKGDKILTTPITFAATANSVLFCGGEIDFVDIDPRTYLMDLNKLEEKLAKAPLGTYKGVIPVDFAGYPIDVERLRKIADKYEVWIIEDACHSPGGSFIDTNGIKQYCGNGRYSDLQIFSFHPVKHIATGEGGMITTQDKELYDKLIMLRTHGITKDPGLLVENHGGWYYEMQELGYNYRLSDIQAALGISQLSRSDQGLKRRNEIAQAYHKAFENTCVKTPYVANNVYHAYHLFVIQVKDRKGLYEFLKGKGIFSQVHYIPVHLFPYYSNLGFSKGDFPISESFYDSCLSIPMYPSLTKEEQNFVINTILDFYKK